VAYGVTKGDFNGDRVLDLAVINCVQAPSAPCSGFVSVFLGNGDGTFEPAINTPVGTQPLVITAGDFNGDGKLDVVVVDNPPTATGPVILLFLGNGDGTFQSPVTVASGGPASYVLAVGDFNGDGKLDLTTESSVYLGNGDGTFQSPKSFSGSLIGVGDFNGDGKLDIAAAMDCPSGGTCVSILLGNGDGTFLAGQNLVFAGTGADGVVADVNGDGKLDLVTADTDDSFGGVRVFLGNGDGTLQAPQFYHVGNGFGEAYDVKVGDFNGDGKPDLVVANNGTSNVSVFLGNGDGTFQSEVDFPAGFQPLRVITGDFNGDGRSDVAVLDRDSVAILLDQGNGTLQTATDYPAGKNAQSVAVGDFNGDGKPDLAIGNFFDGTISIRLGNADGTFRSPLTFTVNTKPWAAAVGDFNGDGKLDLVTICAGCGNGEVLLGNGDGTFQSAPSFTVGNTPESLVVADFNGDGKPDLGVANETSPTVPGSVSILLGNGDGTFRPAVNYTVGKGPASIAFGDVNHDGKLDLLTANQGSADISVLLGNGDGTFRPSQNFPAGSFPNGVTLGDFNGDGKLDAAVANQTCLFSFATTPGPQATPCPGGSVAILMGNGDGTFQVPRSHTVHDGPIAIAAVDMNGDGKLDVAVLNNGSNDMSILLGNGNGQFRDAMNFGVGVYPVSFAMGDFNGDGKLDLASANSGSFPDFSDVSISVLINNTPPSISSFNPSSGPAGTTGVNINGTAATTFWATSDTQLNVKIPSGATSGPITVANTAGTTTGAANLTVN